MHAADLGCGTGFFTLELARAVGPAGSVAAVDVMQEPLQSVQGLAEAQGLANIRIIRADLEVAGSTGIPDHSQDVSLLKNILFQSQKKDAIIREAMRILKPGGKLVVIDWRKGVPGLGPPDDLRSSPEELVALVQEQGAKMDREISAGSAHMVLVFKK
jgi:ubiquinone/menaquinone biosynthesis C-methylase UbiE